jgi:hypothetical protein
MALAAHGVVFAIGSVTVARLAAPQLEVLGWIYFFAVIAPAMILAIPFSPLLWRFHLMETPGWFAWPKPVGFALVYAAWVAALLLLALLARSRER